MNKKQRIAQLIISTIPTIIVVIQYMYADKQHHDPFFNHVYAFVALCVPYYLLYIAMLITKDSTISTLTLVSNISFFILEFGVWKTGVGGLLILIGAIHWLSSIVFLIMSVITAFSIKPNKPINQDG